MGMRKGKAGAAAGMILALTAPVTTTIAQTAAAPAAGQTQGYVLGAEDVVEVDVLGRSDFKTRARVRPDGTILLPLIGNVRAADRTALELGAQIASALKTGGFFANPIVSVEIASYASRYVTVLGAVGSPGLVPVDRGYHLSEILARVGGVRENGADFVVLRPANGPEQRVLIETLATGDRAQDPLVAPGDKIYIPAAQTFYIYGQVNAPGAYPLATDMTLRKALARGGGLSASGSDKRVKVYRGGKELKRFDLGGDIEPGDVIVVGERFF